MKSIKTKAMLIMAVFALSMVSTTTYCKVKVKISECQKLQQKKPATRGFGTASHYDQSTARTYAAAVARAELANTISAKILSETERMDTDWTQYVNNGRKAASVDDSGTHKNNVIRTLSQEVVSNTVIKLTEWDYNKKTKEYTAYVCVEYQGDAAEMARSISRKICQQVSDEVKEEIKGDIADFEERLRNSMEWENKAADE